MMYTLQKYEGVSIEQSKMIVYRNTKLVNFVLNVMHMALPLEFQCLMVTYYHMLKCAACCQVPATTQMNVSQHIKQKTSSAVEGGDVWKMTFDVSQSTLQSSSDTSK